MFYTLLVEDAVNLDDNSSSTGLPLPPKGSAMVMTIGEVLGRMFHTGTRELAN